MLVTYHPSAAMRFGPRGEPALAIAADLVLAARPARGCRRDPDRRVEVPTAADMHALGRRLARLLRAGDLVVLAGDLGAGKTTLTQGLGAGLGVRGDVTSPTFVIARVHRVARRRARPLVHVDAYRLGSLAEVDDLDLDASLEDSVTVVEWGERQGRGALRGPARGGDPPQRRCERRRAAQSGHRPAASDADRADAWARDDET